MTVPTNFSMFDIHQWHECLHHAGICALGIAPATHPITWPHYQHVIEKTVPPQLQYLVKNAECRIHFDDILAGTRSIICAAIQLPAIPDSAPCRFARFCHIGDYHQIVRERLQKIENFVRENFPSIENTRICVDSAPVLERELAVRSGIGTTGFQHQIIHPEYGSHIVLGEMFVDIDLMPYRSQLEYHASHEIPEEIGVIPGAQCTCRAGHRLCASACPTGALSESGYDMNRCLAYWSTQHKGDIPEAFAQAMGDVLWGCDRCQQSCPRNKGISLPISEPTPLSTLTLKEILGLSGRQLKKRLSGTSIGDAHPYMLQRNACIVIGNRRESLYERELAAVFETHPCEWVRRAAERGLSKLSETKES